MSQSPDLTFYGYILYSAAIDQYYIGSTADLEDRIKRHNGGRSKATKKGIPWVLVYCEHFSTRPEAYQREMQLKSWKSRRLIESLIRKS